MEYYLKPRCDRHLRLTKRDETQTQTHVELFPVWKQGGHRVNTGWTQCGHKVAQTQTQCSSSTTHRTPTSGCLLTMLALELVLVCSSLTVDTVGDGDNEEGGRGRC